MYFSEGFRRFEASELTSEQAIDVYKRDHLLWIRLSETDRKKCDNFNVLKELSHQYQTSKATFEKDWHIENVGQLNKQELSPEKIFATASPPSGSWYCSAILQRNKDATSGFFSSVPFRKPALFKSAQHDDGTWLFIGSNPTSSCGKVGKKRSRDEVSSSLTGRTEHVDDVDHSGTWHVQLCGTKTWYIRPCNSAEDDWVFEPPMIMGNSKLDKKYVDGERLRIVVEQGDLFIINTRAWFHRTIIEPQSITCDGISCSYARDFYLPLIVPEDTLKDEVVLTEEQIPDYIPRSSTPNCCLAEAEFEGEEQIVMVALKNLKAGDSITVAKDEEELDELDDDEYDASEQAKIMPAKNVKGLDPRIVCSKSYKAEDVVLSGDSIPEALPSSKDPTCKLENDGNILRALRDLEIGDVFCVAVKTDEEFEEYEWDPTSESLVLVK